MEIDISTLDNTFFNDKGGWFAGPPSTSGVYAISVKLDKDSTNKNKKERILYIGASRNIKKRITQLNHPYRLIYDRFQSEYYVQMLIVECENPFQVENILINIFKPFLNKQKKHG